MNNVESLKQWLQSLVLELCHVSSKLAFVIYCDLEQASRLSLTILTSKIRIRQQSL